jgi:hypothetical protein
MEGILGSDEELLICPPGAREARSSCSGDEYHHGLSPESPTPITPSTNLS